MRPLTLARSLPLVFVLALAAFLTACENKVTDANYNKITNGMMLSQVEGLLGGKGADETALAGYNISGAGVMGSTASPENIYTWKNKESKYIITVKDGKVVAK